MEHLHLLLKAVSTTTTDLGEFEAVISTRAIDREGDVVEPAAMVSALRAWAVINKVVPLHWNHSSDPEDIVGHVDPKSVKAVGDEVVASGKVDLDTARGGEIWRLVKSGAIGFSFGYLVPDGGAFKRGDGGRTITQLDVFEITVTPAPMNAQTRVLSTKAKAVEDDDERTPTDAELERRLLDAGLITSGPADAEKYRQADPVMTGLGPNGHAETKNYDDIRIKTRDQMLALFAAAGAERKAIAGKAKERKAAEPIKVATFEC